MQVCFQKWTFANPVKSPKCTTGSLEPVNGINKDVSGARLLPTTVLTYLVDWVCFCHWLKTQHYCLCPNGSYNLPLATHPPSPTTYPLPITCHSWYYSRFKKVAQNPIVLAKTIPYKFGQNNTGLVFINTWWVGQVWFQWLVDGIFCKPYVSIVFTETTFVARGFPIVISWNLFLIYTLEPTLNL